MSLHLLFSGKPLPPKCPQCNGEGGWKRQNRQPGESPIKVCGACEGDGYDVNSDEAMESVRSSAPASAPKCELCDKHQDALRVQLQSYEALCRQTQDLAADYGALATENEALAEENQQLRAQLDAIATILEPDEAPQPDEDTP